MLLYDIDLNKYKYEGLYGKRDGDVKVLMFKHKVNNSIQYLYTEPSEERAGKFDIIFGSSADDTDFYKINRMDKENYIQDKAKILEAYMEYKQQEIDMLQKELNRVIDIVGFEMSEANI